jgi:hypothetical protein
VDRAEARNLKHCTDYAWPGPGRPGAVPVLDALRLFQFRRCWNTAIASATLLAISCPVANAERFSIKCVYGSGVIYMSFDTDSGKVVEETLSGQPLKGRIDKVDGDRIDFHIVIPGRPDMDIVWDGSKKTFKVLAIPGDKYRTGDIVECADTELRSMLSEYDKMP